MVEHVPEHREGCPGPPTSQHQGQCLFWCYGHMACEYDESFDPVNAEPPPTARICFECCHVFKTDEELVQADLQVRHDMWANPLLPEEKGPGVNVPPLPRAVDDIWVCPVCTHDL